MSELNAKKRKSLSNKEFALPESRKYPVDTKNRAKNAKARASQMEHEGKISKSTESRIDAKANKVLKSSKRK